MKKATKSKQTAHAGAIPAATRLFGALAELTAARRAQTAPKPLLPGATPVLNSSTGIPLAKKACKLN